MATDGAASRTGGGLRRGLLAIAILATLAGLAPVATAGDAALAHEGHGADATLELADLEEQTVWRGQVVAIEGFEAGERVAVRSADDEHELAADGNGTVLLDTEPLAAGEWTVAGEERDTKAPLTVDEQSLDAVFDPSWAVHSTSLTLDSDRESYEVTLSAAGVGASDFDRALERGRPEDGRYVLPVEDGSASFDLDVSRCSFPSGEHDVLVDVTDANASASRTITAARHPVVLHDLSVESGSYHYGDRVRMEVESNVDSAALQLRDADHDRYEAAVTLSDVGECDEPTVLTWDTRRAFADDAGIEVQNGRIDSLDPAADPLPEDHDRYPAVDELPIRVTVWGSKYEVEDGLYDDRSTLTLEPRRLDGVRVLAAPADHAVPRDAEELAPALDAAGTGPAADRDLLLVGVDAAGPFEFEGPEPQALADAGLELSLARAGADGAESELLNVTEPPLADAASVVHDPDGDGFSVAVEADALPEPTGDGEEWTVKLSRTDEHPYTRYEEWDGTGSVRLEPATLELVGDDHGGDLVLPASDDATIAAETTLANGTAVDVIVETPDGNRTAIATVADGEVVADVDLSALSRGDRLTPVRLRAPGAELAGSTSGVVSEDASRIGPSFAVDASAPADVQARADATLEVTVVNEGDEAGTADLDLTLDGESRDSPPVELAPGASHTRRVDVDTDEAGAVAWTADVGTDVASGSVEVEAVGGGDGVATGDEVAASGEARGDDVIPGFGALAALLGLLAAGSLAARR